MAEQFYPEPISPITLDDFILYIDNHSSIIRNLNNSVYNIDEMNEVAFQLASLSANKNVLAAKLCEELHDVSNFQSTNNFKPLTIMLYEGENYIIRSLIWFPPGPLYPADAFFYYEPHDHNFDFFTVGHFGSGYSTELYDYDHDKVEGVEGEKVNLDYLGTTTLPVGKVMYYYGSKDAHIQYPPDDITVTLNLVLSKHNTTKNRQYKFIMPETKVSCEARLAGGRIIRSDQHEILCEMLIKTQELNNIEFVRKIAHSNNNATIRASAWLALLKHDTINKEDLTILKADKDQYVMKLKQEWSINV